LRFFARDFWIVDAEKPASVGRRRAWVNLSISLAVSVQAMAVRRHGGSMMVVMTVLEAGLHLNQT
jgi:hypothetical protein